MCGYTRPPMCGHVGPAMEARFVTGRGKGRAAGGAPASAAWDGSEWSEPADTGQRGGEVSQGNPARATEDPPSTEVALQPYVTGLRPTDVDVRRVGTPLVPNGTHSAPDGGNDVGGNEGKAPGAYRGNASSRHGDSAEASVASEGASPRGGSGRSNGRLGWGGNPGRGRGVSICEGRGERLPQVARMVAGAWRGRRE